MQHPCRADRGWYNSGYIFPEGFSSRVSFRSSVVLDQLCVHECSVIGRGGKFWPAPTFRVTALDRSDEPLIAKSCTGCWSAVSRTYPNVWKIIHMGGHLNRQLSKGNGSLGHVPNVGCAWDDSLTDEGHYCKVLNRLRERNCEFSEPAVRTTLNLTLDVGHCHGYCTNFFSCPAIWGDR